MKGLLSAHKQHGMKKEKSVIYRYFLNLEKSKRRKKGLLENNLFGTAIKVRILKNNNGGSQIVLFEALQW